MDDEEYYRMQRERNKRFQQGFKKKIKKPERSSNTKENNKPTPLSEPNSR